MLGGAVLHNLSDPVYAPISFLSFNYDTPGEGHPNASSNAQGLHAVVTHAAACGVLGAPQEQVRLARQLTYTPPCPPSRLPAPGQVPVRSTGKDTWEVVVDYVGSPGHELGWTPDGTKFMSE
jgi:hypothetical protein